MAKVSLPLSTKVENGNLCWFKTKQIPKQHTPEYSRGDFRRAAQVDIRYGRLAFWAYVG